MSKKVTPTNIAAFEQQAVRRVWHGEQWYFVVEDVVRVLIDSKDAKRLIYL